MQTTKLSSTHSNLLLALNLCHVSLVPISMKNVTEKDKATSCIVLFEDLKEFEVLKFF